MLTHRLVLTLTINDGQLSRTKWFRPDRHYTLNFVDLELADEIVLLDITRSGPSEKSWRVMRDFADRLFLPLTMGGWVRSVDDAKRLLREYGADKVLVNTAAHENPGLIGELANAIGSQSVVAGVDGGSRTVWKARGSLDTGRDPANWALFAQQWGAGELFTQAKERDGSLQGYDLSLCRSVVEASTLPVVINTGCGNWSHMAAAFDAGASGASTQNIFHFTRNGLMSAKSWLLERGYHMRPAA